MRIPRSPYHCCTSRRWPAADERASDEVREWVPHISSTSRGRTSRNDPLVASARQRSGSAPSVAYAATTAASIA